MHFSRMPFNDRFSPHIASQSQQLPFIASMEENRVPPLPLPIWNNDSVLFTIKGSDQGVNRPCLKRRLIPQGDQNSDQIGNPTRLDEQQGGNEEDDLFYFGHPGEDKALNRSGEEGHSDHRSN